MGEQLAFDFEHAPGATSRPKRLSRQQDAILALLRSGPATNIELSRIGQRFGARINELRKMGYRIDIVARDHESGVNMYELTE